MNKEPNQSELQVKNPNPNQKQNPSNKESSLRSDFNLAPVSQQDLLQSAQMSRRISVLRSFVIFISVVFSILLIANFVLNMVIDAQKRTQDRLLVVVASYYNVEKRVEEIGRKTIVYKKILNEKTVILSKYKFVLDNLGDKVRYKSLSLNGKGFSIALNVNTPLDFTNLILRYLDGDVVSEIIIESASLSNKDKTYDVYIRGVFK